MRSVSFFMSSLFLAAVISNLDSKYVLVDLMEDETGPPKTMARSDEPNYTAMAEDETRKFKIEKKQYEKMWITRSGDY